MKLFQSKAGTGMIVVLAEKSHDLVLTGDVSHFLRWIRSRAGSFAGCRFPIETARAHEVIDRLLESPAPSVEIYVHAYASGTVAGKPKDLAFGS